MTKKLTLLILGYNRPDYFNQQIACLNNLTAPDTDLEIVLYLDGGRKSAQAQYLELSRKIKWPKVIPVCADAHRGIGVSKYRALEFVFETLHRDTLIYLEDDLLVSPYYLVVVTRLDTRLRAIFNNIGCVGSVSACSLAREEKSHHLHEASDSCSRMDNYLMPKSTWDLIKPLLQDATYKFYWETYPQEVDVNQLRLWMLEKLDKMPEISGENVLVPDWNFRDYFRNNPPVSPDALLSFALKMNGLVYVTTRVNRAQHIGRHGTYCNEYAWLRYYYATHLDVFEEDSNFEQLLTQNGW